MNGYESIAEIAVKPAVAGMPGYGVPPSSAPVKLNQNESAFPLGDDLRRRICERLMTMDWRRYPPDKPAELLKLLSGIHHLPEDCFIFGNGSNEIILALWMACVPEEAVVLTVEPTFTLYRLLSTVIGSRFETVPLDRDFEYDIAGLLEASRRLQPRLIVLASPNNPTGTMLPPGALELLLRSTDGIVALDEAYIDYSGDPRGGLDLIERFPNLMVFRTFSKAMSAAGLRLGYGVACPALAREVNKVRLPYNVDWFSRSAASVLLESREVLQQNVKATMELRDNLYIGMKEIKGIRVIPSRANFILFECLKRDPREVFEALLERGVLIRNVSNYPYLDRGLRVSVGQAEENNQFLDSLRDVLKGA